MWINHIPIVKKIQVFLPHNKIYTSHSPVVFFFGLFSIFNLIVLIRTLMLWGLKVTYFSQMFINAPLAISVKYLFLNHH